MTKEQQLQTILLSVQSLDNKLAKERALIANYADEIETFVNTAQADQETAILSLDSLQGPLDALNVTQSSIDTTLALAENKVNQADSRVTSISNDSSNTRAVVNTVLQQTVHPDVIWTEGSDTYSIPGGAVPVYESIQTQLTSLDASVAAAQQGPEPEFVLDEANNPQGVKFLLRTDGSVLAEGTPTSDVTYDAASESLVFPTSASHIGLADGTTKVPTWGKTIYMVVSLSQLNAINQFWRYTPNGFYAVNTTLLWLRSSGELKTMMGDANGIMSDVTATITPPAIDVPFLLTFAHSETGAILLLNGVHVPTSPKTHPSPLVAPDQTGTSGSMGIMGEISTPNEGSTGRLFTVRIYGGVHSDTEINNVKGELESELSLTF